MWGWVRNLLLHPEALRQSLEEAQAQQKRESQPLRDHLSMMDDLLAENRRKLEKLLDVYLSSDLSKETFVEHDPAGEHDSGARKRAGRLGDDAGVSDLNR